MDQKEYHKQRRIRLKEKGLCPICGKQPPLPNKVECQACNNKLKNRRQTFFRKGLCVICGKNPIITNLRICLDCSNKAKLRLQKLKHKVIQHYGGECSCCGEAQLEFLCIDHINGGGNQHRKLFTNSGAGRHLYEWLIKNSYPQSFQVMCFNCNHAKGLFGVCPHNVTAVSLNTVQETKKSVTIELFHCKKCGTDKELKAFRQPNGIRDRYCRECRNNLERKHRVNTKIKCLESYGGIKCVCCGETHLEFLTLDHVNGDGARHRERLGKNNSGNKFYQYLKKMGYPEGYRVMCMNCNFAKSHFDKCPHERDKLN